MIAIPVMHKRVAPVLNWCSRMLIFSERPDERLVEELELKDLTIPECLQLLKKQGVTTLICGTLSRNMEYQARGLGLKIISGVAGEVDEVLQAHRQKRLDRPEFRLPGYRAPGNGKRVGPADFYRCPSCNPRALRNHGVPCIHVTCPRCGKPMVRDKS